MSNTVILDSTFQPNHITFQLLSKTPTFIPTPTNCPHKEIKSKVLDFVRKLQWQFSHIPKFDYHPTNRFGFSKSHNWPPRDLIPNNILEISKSVICAANSILENCSCCYPSDNLNNQERSEIERMRNSDIVVKPADKGQRWTIMSKNAHNQEVMRLLNDENNYSEILSPLTVKVDRRIEQILRHLKEKKFISKKELDYLMPPPSPSNRKFNILPKIHKAKWPQIDMPPGRPIVSDINSVSRNVANFLDYYLKPLAQNSHSYVSDTNHVIGILRHCILPADSIFFTLDVESLYTKVPVDETIKLISDLFLTNPDTSRPDLSLLTLLQLLLSNNDFEYNSQYWLQTCGASMGGAFSGSFCNIFMNFWEAKAIDTFCNKPHTWLRFQDDIFGIWTHGKANLLKFFEHLGNQHNNINVTPVFNQDSIIFLDLEIYKLNDKIGYRTAFKETDSHLTLNPCSYHPKHTFKGVIYSLIYRYANHSSTRDDFNLTLTTVKRAWRSQSFTRSFIRNITKSVLNNTNQLTTWNTGFFACSELNCKVCYFAKEVSVIKSITSNIVYPIFHNINCKTIGVIYIIQCTHCNVRYVGQTSRSLTSRISEHIYAIRNNHSIHSSVAEHFNSVSCSIENFKFCGVEICKKQNKRLNRENLWIKRLDSINTGLNSTLNINVPNETRLIIPFSNCSERVANTINHICSGITNTSRVYTRNKNLKQYLSFSR